ncbi:hypothetical protein ACFL0M_11630 [Thermodesulfobacteriota bacterium]
MQIRFATDLSADEYVRRQAWRDAALDTCPLHNKGGCRFASHGTYTRQAPQGTKIARWYCPDGHSTFSLLPDCLSSRLPGSLIEVETAINEVENAPSHEAAVHDLRLDVGFSGVLRWIRRRLFLVRATLTLLIELLPILPQDCRPCILSFKAALGVEYVLPALRIYAEPYLYVLPPPVGFGPRPQRKKGKKKSFQHKTGTDPPQKRE